MKPFNLEEYLTNPTRQIITRDRKNVRIICTDANEDEPIVALVPKDYNPNSKKMILKYHSDGTLDGKSLEDSADLFFADDNESTELTEFEKEFNRIVQLYVDKRKYPSKEDIKHYSKCLIELAKEELRPEIDKELDEAYKSRDEIVYLEGYDKGQEDAKKIQSNSDFATFKNQLGICVEDAVNGWWEKNYSLDY